MDSQKPDNDRKQEKTPIPFKKRPFRFSISFLFSSFLLAVLVYRIFTGLNPAAKEIPYSEFKTALSQGKIGSVLVSEQKE